MLPFDIQVLLESSNIPDDTGYTMGYVVDYRFYAVGYHMDKDLYEIGFYC